MTLDHYEFMQNMLDRAQQLRETDAHTIYYIEAFTGDRLQWAEWAIGEEERESIIEMAVDSGFTYTVETEVE